MGWFSDSSKRIDEHEKALRAINAKAQARGRKHHDDYDAQYVDRLRKLGKETGQTKHYEKQAQKYLKSRGY